MTLDSYHRSRLEALEALEKAATPGPWFARSLSPDDPNGYSLECDIEGAPWEIGEGNWPFVAEARNLLPALIAVARAARQAYAILGPRVEMPCTCEGCDCENAMAAAELQAALALLDEGDAR